MPRLQSGAAPLRRLFLKKEPQSFPHIPYGLVSSSSSSLALVARVCAPSVSPLSSSCWACFRNVRICEAVTCSSVERDRLIPFKPCCVPPIRSAVSCLVLSPSALSPVVNCPMGEPDTPGAEIVRVDAACAVVDPLVAGVLGLVAAAVCVVSVDLDGAGFGFLRTFLGVGGGKGTLCADGGGSGEASGVSDFSCCWVVSGGGNVPFPVCNGGACACCGGDAAL